MNEVRDISIELARKLRSMPTAKARWFFISQMKFAFEEAGIEFFGDMDAVREDMLIEEFFEGEREYNGQIGSGYGVFGLPRKD